MILFPGLIFLAVIAGCAALYFWQAPRKMQSKINALMPAPEQNQWCKTVARFLAPLAKLSTPTGEQENAEIHAKFTSAGFSHGDVHLLFFSAKTLLPLIFAGLAYCILDLKTNLNGFKLANSVLLAATVGWYLPNGILNWTMRQRQREVFVAFPDVADLLLVCIEAGLGIDAALNMVAKEIHRTSTIMAEELHLTNLAVRAGGNRETALQQLAARTGVEEILAFATMLTQAEAHGASIGESVRNFSSDLRHQRQLRAEILAEKLPTKMLFPLVFFIFPSVLLVMLGPAAIKLIRTLSALTH